jgi:hypothetical protein
MRFVALALLAIVGCRGGKRTSSDWDADATAKVSANVDQMFADIDAGNFAAMTDALDADASAYDVDPGGKPVAMYGRDGVKSYFDTMAPTGGAPAPTMHSTIKKKDCHATGVMGYCAVEFDQSVTVGGVDAGTFHFRGTLISRKVGEDWKWVHWHGSFAELPAPQAAP